MMPVSSVTVVLLAERSASSVARVAARSRGMVQRSAQAQKCEISSPQGPSPAGRADFTRSHMTLLSCCPRTFLS